MLLLQGDMGQSKSWLHNVRY